MADEHKNIIWLTQDAYDKLSSELEFLKGEGRQKVSTKIAQARDEGDLSENGGYHAAREEQGKNEARIRQLKHLLEHAKSGAPDSADDEVAQAMRVRTGETGDDAL